MQFEEWLERRRYASYRRDASGNQGSCATEIAVFKEEDTLERAPCEPKEGDKMTSGDLPRRGGKGRWTEEQWEIYRRAPWIVRRLADVAVLIPGLPNWLASKPVTNEAPPPRRAMQDNIARHKELRPPPSALVKRRSARRRRR
jgi:hypothetical protein